MEGNKIKAEQDPKRFHFDRDPSLSELWVACVYNLLYNVEEYKRDLEKLFNKLGITKKSKVIDIAAGGGFPTIDLLKDGYQVTPTDGLQDGVNVFNARAEKLGLKERCLKALWSDLPEVLPQQEYEFLFCRGNSFIFSAGGYSEGFNEGVEVDEQKALEACRETLKIFYDLLKTGGWIYIDKFKDTEVDHYEKVGEIQVGSNKPEDLIFWTQLFPEKRLRRSIMIRKPETSKPFTPNVGFMLSGAEVEKLFNDVGFKVVKKITMDSEKIFDVWVAQK